MPKGTQVKPTHKAVKTYYAALAAYADQSIEHEGAVRSAFQNLLADTGRKVGWTLIPNHLWHRRLACVQSSARPGHSIRPDGTFRDEFTIERGYWGHPTHEWIAKVLASANCRDPTIHHGIDNGCKCEFYTPRRKKGGRKEVRVRGLIILG